MANVFTLAKAYQKKHPRTAWQDCIKAVSGKKRGAVSQHKSATVGSSGKKYSVVVNDYRSWGLSKREHIVIAPTAEDARQKFARANNVPTGKVVVTRSKISGVPNKKGIAPKKVKVKIKPGKKGVSSITISGIHLSKTREELQHQHSLMSALAKHKSMLKEKGLTAGEKAQIRKDIASYQRAIKTSKQHVTALKRSI